jgi:MATE family multidrug resistance protein
MGLSNLVEITAFTLIALFIAPLGATVVAGHRIVANVSALTYMLPLSLAIAVMVAVGQAVGACDRPLAHAHIKAGLLLAGGLSTLAGLFLWLAAEPIAGAYTNDPEVRAVALTLVIYVAVYQFFDALQTVAGHVLRAYRVTFVPMLLQVFCFWGVGLGGGWWLCYHAPEPMGVAGFWLASVISLVLAAGLLGSLLHMSVRASESAP